MKSLFISFLFAFTSLGAYAQYSLIFCEDVNPEGVPKMPASAFMVSDRGGVLRFMVRGDEELNMDSIKYQLYFINQGGDEEFVTEFMQNVEPGWNYAWKEVVFFDPGNYRVKVIDSKDSYLTSANLTIKRP